MYTYILCIYIYIYIHTKCVYTGDTKGTGVPIQFMYGFYYNFKNLHFRKSQNIDDCSAAHVVICFISSEVLKCFFCRNDC